MESLDKYKLALAGEYRVASELLKRGLLATLTLGNQKAVDLIAIGQNKRAVMIEVKSSQKSNVVTGFFQKYREPKLADAPDFWVLYRLEQDRQKGTSRDRFFVLSHSEMAMVQGRGNWRYLKHPPEDLSLPRDWAKISAGVEGGVDNVRFSDLVGFEDQWAKIVVACDGRG